MKLFILGAIVATVLVIATPTFAATVAKMTGIKAISTIDWSTQRVSKFTDYDNGATCYTLADTNGGYPRAISCVK